MNHTPGPWFVSTEPDRDEDGSVGPNVYDCDGGVFAVMEGEPETIAQPWREADAHLIAAAPDLLAALELFLRWWGESRDIYEAAVKAGRKARGVE